jgi:ABC-type nitrate/sulfonate/bicarbonate transport system substrate-binding protein
MSEAAIGNTRAADDRRGAMMERRLRRVAFLAAVLLTCTPAFAQDMLRVGKAGREAFSFVPVDIGDRMGFFKKRGLSVEISSFAGDARLQQAMAADAIDMSLSSGVGMAFILKGAPVKAVAAFADPPLLFALVVPKDSHLKSEADLQGRTVGVSGVGSVTQWLVNRIAVKQGWGLGAIKVVGIGENAARVAAVQSKSIDGGVVDIASALNYAKSGNGRILARFGDTVRDFHVHVMFATDKAIAEKPKAVTSFIAGWFETIRFMRANKAKSVEIAAEVMGTDQEMAAAIYDELMPMLSDQGHFNPKALDVLAKSFVELNMLPAEPDMPKLYTEALLPK